MYALHDGRFGSKPNLYSRRRKLLKLKVYVGCASGTSSCSDGNAATGDCTSVIVTVTRKSSNGKFNVFRTGRSLVADVRNS